MNSLSFGAIPYLSSNLSVSGFTWDLAAILFLVLVIFFFGITSGRDRLLALLLALYAAASVARVSPQALSVFVASGLRVSPFTQFTVFILFSFLMSFLLSGKLFLNIFRFSAKGLRSVWQVIVLSILICGLLASLILQFLPYNALAISPPVAYIFRDGFAPLVWSVAPVLFLIFLRVEEND